MFRKKQLSTAKSERKIFETNNATFLIRKLQEVKALGREKLRKGKAPGGKSSRREKLWRANGPGGKSSGGQMVQEGKALEGKSSRGEFSVVKCSGGKNLGGKNDVIF